LIVDVAVVSEKPVPQRSGHSTGKQREKAKRQQRTGFISRGAPGAALYRSPSKELKKSDRDQTIVLGRWKVVRHFVCRIFTNTLNASREKLPVNLALRRFTNLHQIISDKIAPTTLNKNHSNHSFH
jgi:hypothetical protein